MCVALFTGLHIAAIVKFKRWFSWQKYLQIIGLGLIVFAVSLFTLCAILG